MIPPWVWRWVIYTVSVFLVLTVLFTIWLYWWSILRFAAHLRHRSARLYRKTYARHINKEK